MIATILRILAVILFVCAACTWQAGPIDHPFEWGMVLFAASFLFVDGVPFTVRRAS